MFNRYFLIFFLFFSPLAHGSLDADGPDQEPTQLTLAELVTTMPETSKRFFDLSVSKEALPIWLTVGLTSAPLIYYDEEILIETQKLGRRWGLSNKDELKSTLKMGDIDILRGPTDISSSLYFLGDGWIHMSTAGLFLATGYLADAPRAVNTGIQLFQGLTLSTILSQVLKRVAGREGPTVRTQPGGAWRPFPSIPGYYRQKTRYDAFPSGHVMVTTLTFVTIRENYPEYESYLLPAQIIYTALLSFGMVNNGIHWAGDYPLGIAIGYFMAKATTGLKRARSDAATAPNGVDYNFFVSYENGTPIGKVVIGF